jgi:hypothetical protein
MWLYWLMENDFEIEFTCIILHILSASNQQISGYGAIK